MGFWDQAQNFVDMGNASFLALQAIERITRPDTPFDAVHAKSVFGLTRAIVLACVEGYQGKIRGADLNKALGMVISELATNEMNNKRSIDSNLVERFKAAL